MVPTSTTRHPQSRISCETSPESPAPTPAYGRPVDPPAYSRELQTLIAYVTVKGDLVTAGSPRHLSVIRSANSGLLPPCRDRRTPASPRRPGSGFSGMRFISLTASYRRPATVLVLLESARLAHLQSRRALANYQIELSTASGISPPTEIGTCIPSQSTRRHRQASRIGAARKNVHPAYRLTRLSTA